MKYIKYKQIILFEGVSGVYMLINNFNPLPYPYPLPSSPPQRGRGVAYPLPQRQLSPSPQRQLGGWGEGVKATFPNPKQLGGEATFPNPNMRQHPLPLQVALGRGGNFPLRGEGGVRRVRDASIYRFFFKYGSKI